MTDAGFFGSCRGDCDLFAWRAGAADRAESKGGSDGTADGDDCGAICGGRLRAAAPAGGQWALRYGAVGFGFGASDLQRAAAGGAEQPGDLRAYGDAAPDCGDADASYSDVRRDENDHIRDMIEELLFTNPGERVNRPDFGSGLLQMVFAPNSPELAAALQFTMQAALQRYLGDVIDLESLEVTALDSTLQVVVKYLVRQTQEPQTETFQRSGVQ
jgi:phage baseplate assembly protein W